MVAPSRKKPVPPVRPSRTTLRGSEKDVAISWQLRVLRGSYGMYVVVTRSTSTSLGLRKSPCMASTGQIYVEVFYRGITYHILVLSPSDGT